MFRVTTIAFCISLASTPACCAEFFVSPQGDDSQPGTKAEPVASLARAHLLVRKHLAKGLEEDVQVGLHGGTYELADTLRFTAEDSGTKQVRVTYAALPGETVVISGGRRITEWSQDSSGVWSAKVPPTADGPLQFRQLWVNGRRAIRARTPNHDAEPPFFQLKDANLGDGLEVHTYTFAQGQLEPWQKPEEVEAVVFGNWEITRKRFLHLDLAAGVAQMAGPHAVAHPAIAPSAGRYFYLENAAEMVDQPGEWYFDRASRVLKYFPRPGEDLSATGAFVPKLMRLVEIAGTPEQPVRNLHFEGLQFMHTGWAPPEGGYLGIQACHFTTGTHWEISSLGIVDAAIQGEHVESCTFTGCTLAHLGGSGISLFDGSRNNVVERNQLFDISANGIMLGSQAGEADVPLDNRIANNRVHKCGVDYHGAVGIWIGFAARTTVAHNRVHNLPYTGISVGWEWGPEPTPCKQNLIANNHIFDVMQQLSDGGGIYTLGYQPGTVIRGNHIHDVHRSPYAHAAPNNGLFIDEGSKGYVFEKNVIHDTAGQPVRHNRNRPEWHTWSENFLNAEDSQQAIDRIVENAGVTSSDQGKPDQR